MEQNRTQNMEAIMREHPATRQAIMTLIEEHCASTKELEQRFAAFLDDIHAERAEQQRRWHNINQKWEENQSIIQNLTRRIDSGIGALGAQWGTRSETSFRQRQQKTL